MSLKSFAQNHGGFASGLLSGAASGAMVGSAFGGVGAIPGAVVGGVLGGGMGIMQDTAKKKGREETSLVDTGDPILDALNRRLAKRVDEITLLGRPTVRSQTIAGQGIGTLLAPKNTEEQLAIDTLKLGRIEAERRRLAKIEADKLAHPATNQVGGGQPGNESGYSTQTVLGGNTVSRENDR